MYSEKETAQKITCPTESDEMNLKRIVRYLKSVPSTKCKSTSGVVQWETQQSQHGHEHSKQ